VLVFSLKLRKTMFKLQYKQAFKTYSNYTTEITKIRVIFQISFGKTFSG